MSALYSKTIYIFKDSFWNAEPDITEHHVVGASSTEEHEAGYSSQFRNIDFWLLIDTDFNELASVYAAGSTITLVDWRGNSYSVKIRALRILRHLRDVTNCSVAVVLQCSAKLQRV